MNLTPLESLLTDVEARLPARLPAADREKLLSLLRAAHHTQESVYHVAVEEAFAHAPALLRSTLRQIMAE